MSENLNLMLVKHLYKEADAQEQFLVQKELLRNQNLRQEYWFLKDTLLLLQMEYEEEPILKAIFSAKEIEEPEEVDLDFSKVLNYSKQTKSLQVPIAN